MALLTKQDLDDFESRLHARLHAIDMRLDDLAEASRSHGTMLGELVRLATALADRRTSHTPGPLTAQVQLSCEEAAP